MARDEMLYIPELNGKFCTIRTAHNSFFLADKIEGRFSHGPAFKLDKTSELVVAYIAQAHPHLCFLASLGEPPIGSGVGRNELSNSVTSYEIIPLDGDNFALRHPISGFFLCAEPLETDGTARIVADRELIGGWETFVFEPLDAKNLPDVLRPLVARGREGFLAQHQLIELTRTDDAASLAVLKAAIAIMPEVDLRELVVKIVDLPAYPKLFNVLQPRLAGGMAGLPYSTEKALSGAVAARGWSIGTHSYGIPEIIDGEYGHLSIGRYCSIAGQVKIILANHATDRATTYPFKALKDLWPNSQLADDDHDGRGVVIEDAVWIGAGACVVPGTRIGAGCIIGAHAVARGDIPPYSVVVGNPGQVTRKLFDTSTIERLLKVAWWNWPNGIVDRFIPLLLGRNIEEFLTKAEQYLAQSLEA